MKEKREEDGELQTGTESRILGIFLLCHPKKTPVRGFNPAVKPWIGGILPKSQLCILGFALKGGEIPVEKGDSDGTEVGIFPLPGCSDPGGIPGGSRLIPGDSMETSWDTGEGGKTSGGS